MGVFTRADSPWFWLYLEPVGRLPGQKERTDLRCDVKGLLRKDNLALAEQRYHQRMTARARGTIEPEAKPARTWHQQSAWFRAHTLPHRKGRERETEILDKLDPVFAGYPLSAITRTLVTELWITPRLTTPTVIGRRTVQAGPRTVNREVAVIKTIVQSAVPDFLEASPLYGMPELDYKTPKRRLMAPDEERRIVAAMAVDDRALFLLGLDSLVRLSDLLDLKRADDHGSRMFIADPKTGDHLEVPISRRARKALDALYKARPESVYIFARRRVADKERDRRGVIRKMLARACEAAGVPYGRKVGGITFHWATRRTGLTRMLANGVNPGAAQKIGGWKTTDVMMTIYHELTDEEGAAAVNMVGRHSRRIPGRAVNRRERER